MGRLPYTNVNGWVDKKDAWLVWTYDKEYKVNDFNIYDFSRGNEYGNKSVGYVEMHRGKSYSDWGASYTSWEACTLADVLFKFGFKEKLVDIKGFLNALSLVKEWRSDVLMYMGFLGMEPYYIMGEE